MPRRYAILGTGALGGYYGGLLARSGAEVHFLLHSDYEHVRRHGLRVESVDGDFQLPEVNAYARPEDLPPCDVAIVALKTTRNAELPRLLPPAVGENGVALVLQNGLGVEADTAKVIGEDRVLGGCCFLCTNKVGPGHIRHLDYGMITFGEYYPPERSAPGVTARVREIVADLQSAGIDARPVEDLWQARWKKLVWNIPFNGLSVVLDAATDTLMRDAEPLVRSLMEDVVHSAAACGREIDPGAIDQMLDHTRQMTPYDSSMRVDWLQGRPMEIEAIFGAPVRAATAAGFDPQRVRMLYQQLQYLAANSRGVGS